MNDKELPSLGEFDYVIVGGGSAGCVLAGRLSADPQVQVALVEAGGAGDDWMVNTPAAVVLMVPRGINNWAFTTVPQPGLNGRCGYQPRGKVLGGSSSINAMVYIRGHREDYDRWARLGNTGWSYADVLPYFIRSEHNQNINDAWHGQQGPLQVGALRSDNPLQEVFLQAAREAGHRINPDFNGAEQEGLGVYQVTQQEGERFSAFRAYVKPHLSRPNLSIFTSTQVDKVLLEQRRATGVVVRRGGQRCILQARREVLLSAGAFLSPQILLLSGIGEAAHLQAHGIEVKHDLPGVGQHLQDHPDFILGYQVATPDVLSLNPAGMWRILRQIAQYRRERRGMISSNFAECGGFLKSAPEEKIPDLQLHFVVALVDDHARKLHFEPGMSCHVCLLRPKSQGSVRLENAHPWSVPRIDPGFLQADEDVQALVRGFKITRHLMQQPALAPYRLRDKFTAGVESDAEIVACLRERADTVYHPVGTCRMGTGPEAVVDPALRVYGIERLRVVDASIMPDLIGGNTNAPTMMIAEKAVDLIRQAQ